MSSGENTPAAFSTKAASRYLSISRAQLYRLFKSGDLHFAKVGGRTLVRRMDLDALLERSIVPGGRS
jgi:excisionase family DNA binding protein